MERKFKHKITNKIIKIGGKTGLSCQTMIGNSNLILGDIIKGDDWEEVVEKDYQILSLARFCSIKPTITDVSDYGDEYIEAMLKCDKARIHSIKRKSDGEIFTINDNTNYGIIKNIHVNGNTFCIMTKDFTVYNSVKTILKVKQLLFTTEDGVDIFEGDNLYSIDDRFNIKKHRLFNARYDDKTLLNNRVFFNSEYKHFSTKEKAEEYILMNKPCLSYGEIQEYLKIKDCNKVLELIQQKLK